MTPRARLTLYGLASLLACLALGATLLWVAAAAIGSSRTLAGVVDALALPALLGLLIAAASVTLRLRRGLAALDAGAGRVGTGDLAPPSGSRAGDETPVRDLAAELERTRQELTERVAQLESMRIQLEVANRLVAADRLARGLTHEINNPLAILLADVEYAFEELEARAAAGPSHVGPPDEVIAALDEARQAGRRIALVVRELMSFSQDRSAADLGPTDLAEVLAHAEQLAGPAIRRHARFVVELPPGPVLVQGNQARMGLAFLELLHGAASAVAAAAAAGRPGRLVSLRLLPDPDGAVVEVLDDGVPVPGDLLPHLFDPFFTPLAGFTAIGAGARGSGMGLASCFAIIRAAGGRLEVESAEGSGTVFRAWLPAASTQSRLALRGRAGPRDAMRHRLLVLDADPFDCASAYRALSADFDVAPHTGVGSALAILRAGERFDLILSDSRSASALVEALTADGSSQVGHLVLVGEPGVPAPAGVDRLDKPLSAAAVQQLVSRRAAGRGLA